MGFTREQTTTLRKLNVILLRDHPFYGHIMASCRWDRQDNMPSVAGLHIRTAFLTLLISEAFFTLHPQEQAFVVTHELMHFLFKHPMRMQHQCTDLKNIAADLAVNSYLHSTSRLDRAESSIYPEQFQLPENRTYEYYLRELQRLVREGKIKVIGTCRCGGGGGSSSKGKPGICPDCGGKKKLQSGEGGDHHWEIESTPEEASELSRKLYNTAKSVGSVPAGLLRELYEAEARISWEELFINAAQSSEMAEEWRFCKRHYSRRYGTIPGVVHEYLGDMKVTVDTSGSMGPKEIGACFSVVDKMRALGYNIQIFEHDAAYLREYPYEGIPPKVLGGGGTCIESTFKHIAMEYPDTDQVFCFTDGVIFDLESARMIADENGWDIVWVLTQSHDMPFGQAILMEVDSEIHGM